MRINKFMPSEIICNDAFYVSGADINDFKERLGITVSSMSGQYFDDDVCKRTILEHFEVASPFCFEPRFIFRPE